MLELDYHWPDITSSNPAGDLFQKQRKTPLKKDKYFDFVIKPGTTNSGSTLILFEQLLPDKHTIVIVIECRYSQPSATKETHRLQTHEIKAKILKTIKKFKPFFKGGTKSKSTELGKLNITKESIYHIFCTFQQVHGDVDIVQFKVKDKAFLLYRNTLRKIYSPTFANLAQYRSASSRPGKARRYSKRPHNALGGEEQDPPKRVKSGICGSANTKTGQPCKKLRPCNWHK